MNKPTTSSSSSSFFREVGGGIHLLASRASQHSNYASITRDFLCSMLLEIKLALFTVGLLYILYSNCLAVLIFFLFLPWLMKLPFPFNLVIIENILLQFNYLNFHTLQLPNSFSRHQRGPFGFKSISGSGFCLLSPQSFLYVHRFLQQLWGPLSGILFLCIIGKYSLQEFYYEERHNSYSIKNFEELNCHHSVHWWI